MGDELIAVRAELNQRLVQMQSRFERKLDQILELLGAPKPREYGRPVDLGVDEETNGGGV